MQRKLARKIARFAKANELEKEGNRPMLEEALSGCHNMTAREKLRGRILRRGGPHP